MQVVPKFAILEFVDGLRFRLFAIYNHDIREYDLFSKFTITRAVCAMVSRPVEALHLQAKHGQGEANQESTRLKSFRILVMRT